MAHADTFSTRPIIASYGVREAGSQLVLSTAFEKFLQEILYRRYKEFCIDTRQPFRPKAVFHSKLEQTHSPATALRR
jgi:hypothetical protein